MAITLERPAFYENKRYAEYCGLSTDNKADIKANNADEFYEIDTGDVYKYAEGSGWIKQESQGGGGSQDLLPPWTVEDAGKVLTIGVDGILTWATPPGYEPPTELPDYLCFTAEEAGSTVAMAVNGTPTKGQAFEYSTNGTNWSEFIPSTTTITLANVGDKVYFRGDNTTVGESYSIYYKFVMSGKIAASGNIMSLLDKTCQSTTISNTKCYYSMFKGCTSLTTAPVLPATTLASDCYSGMFNGCTSLTTAPALPATTLASHCYSNMFNGCTSLTTAPVLPATTLASDCYSGMFNGCTSLTTAPALPATVMADYCYYSMFQGCTSLTTAPALPATTLASDCYSSMFNGCTSLQVYSSSETGHTKAWRIPTSGSASSYTSQDNMFRRCPGSYTSSSTVTLNRTFYTQNTPV